MEDILFSEWINHSSEVNKGNPQELPDSPLLGVAMDYNILHSNKNSNSLAVLNHSGGSTSGEDDDSTPFSPFVYNSFCQSHYTKNLIPSPPVPEEGYPSPSSVSSPPPSSSYTLFLDEQDTTFISEYIESSGCQPQQQQPSISNQITQTINIQQPQQQLSESGSYSVPSSLTSSPYITSTSSSSSIVPTFQSGSPQPQRIPNIDEQHLQYYEQQIEFQKAQQAAYFSQNQQQHLVNFNNVHNKIPIDNSNQCQQYHQPTNVYIQPLSLYDLNNTIKLQNNQQPQYYQISQHQLQYQHQQQFHQSTEQTLVVKKEFTMSTDFLEQQKLAQEKLLNNNVIDQKQYCPSSSATTTPYSYSPELTSSTPPPLTSSSSVPTVAISAATPTTTTNSQSASRTNKSGNKPRKLIEICDLFIKEYSNAALLGNNQVYIDLFAMKHGVDLTRMYSILHVMKCIGIIDKRGHNSYHWIGLDAIPAAIEAIFHSTTNYLTGKPEFACEKCRQRESSQQLHQQHHQHQQSTTTTPDQQLNHSDESDSDDSEMTESSQTSNSSTTTTTSKAAATTPTKQPPTIASPKLSHIYKQFIKQFFLHPNVSCKDAKEMYNIQLTTAKSRRLYDMALILDSINLITKDDASKNKIQYYKWQGSPTLDELRQSSCLINSNIDDDE